MVLKKQCKFVTQLKKLCILRFTASARKVGPRYQEFNILHAFLGRLGKKKIKKISSVGHKTRGKEINSSSLDFHNLHEV